MSFTQVPPNSTGNKIDCVDLIDGADTVQRQVVVIGDPLNATAIEPVGSTSETGTITSFGQSVAINLNGRKKILLLITATTLSTFTSVFEASFNSTNGTDGDWFSVRGVRTNANTVETATPAISAGNYAWRFGLDGFSWFRIRCIAGMSGTANITLIATTNADDPVPASEGGPASQSGTWIFTAEGRSDRGATTNHHLVSSASTNATLVSNGSRAMECIHFSNNSSTDEAYLKLYNTSSVPTAGTGTPVKVIMAPPMSTITVSGSASAIRFTAGVGYTITGGAANTDTTAVAAEQCIVGITYA